MTHHKYQTVDEYIRSIPTDHQEKLTELRNIIKSIIPEATEVISYNMPAYKYHGILVYFAAYTNHLGFYPTPSAITSFKDQLSNYKSSKGAIQFPFDQELPKALIEEICLFRLQELQLKK